MRKIFYTQCDNGDGSFSTWFFDSQECIDYLEEHNPDSWAPGEGGSHFWAGDVSGITVYNMQQVLDSFDA